MEKPYSVDTNQEDSAQMVKDKRISNNSASEIAWPFSSTVFLPPPYNAPLNASAQENDTLYTVAAPSLWHTSSFDHNNAKPHSLYKNMVSKGTPSSSIPSFANGSLNTTTAFRSFQLPTSLTLVYSGSLHVYQGVSPATVETIKSMASKEHSFMSLEPEQISLAKDTKLQPSNAPQAAAYSVEMTPAKFIAGALTMARKATLARFLQRRKYRLASRKPYQVTNEKKLYCPTPQSPTMSYFNFLPILLQDEGTGSSSDYSI